MSMTAEELEAAFEKHTETYGPHTSFDSIPDAEKRHKRRDLCGFLYLDEKCPAKAGYPDIVAGAEHDKIWLSAEASVPASKDNDYNQSWNLTDEDVLYLVRCGVMFEREYDSFCMFA